jgi:hypothetical protein
MARRFGRKSHEKIEEKTIEVKRGQLKSSRSGRIVRHPKQAIAIALSEARKQGGGLVPAMSRSRTTTKRAAAAKRKTKAKTRTVGVASTRRSYSKKRSSRSRKAQ